MFYILFIKFLWLLTLHPIWMLLLNPMAHLAEDTEVFFTLPPDYRAVFPSACETLQWFSHVALRDLNSVLFSSPDVDSRSSRGVVPQVILSLFKKTTNTQFSCVYNLRCFQAGPARKYALILHTLAEYFAAEWHIQGFFLFCLVLHLLILFKTTKPHNTAEPVFL